MPRVSSSYGAFTVRAPPRPSETHGPDRPDNINVRASLHVASFELPPCVPLRASGSRSVVPPATSRGSTVLFGIICTVPVEYVYEASLSLQRRRRCHRLLPCAEKPLLGLEARTALAHPLRTNQRPSPRLLPPLPLPLAFSARSRKSNCLYSSSSSAPSPLLSPRAMYAASCS